jgi:hypothetical protein
MDEQSKKLADETGKSDYFDFIVETRVKEKSSELWKKYGLRLKLVLTVLTAAVGVFGLGSYFSYDKLKQQYTEYTTKVKQADAILKQCQEMLKDVSNSNTATEGLRQSVKTMEEAVIQDQRKLNQDTKEDLSESIRELNQFNLPRIRDDMISARDSAKTLLDAIRSYQEKIDPQIAVLQDLAGKIRIASAVRHLFVERGDKWPSGDEYRPARMQLPYSKDVIEARFHQAVEDDYPKVIQVDIYRNNEMVCENQIFTDVESPSSQPGIVIKSTDGYEYNLRAIFIYLPPNPLVYRMPDFCVLELRMTGA